MRKGLNATTIFISAVSLLMAWFFSLLYQTALLDVLIDWQADIVTVDIVIMLSMITAGLLSNYLFRRYGKCYFSQLIAWCMIFTVLLISIALIGSPLNGYILILCIVILGVLAMVSMIVALRMAIEYIAFNQYYYTAAAVLLISNSLAYLNNIVVHYGYYPLATGLSFSYLVGAWFFATKLKNKVATLSFSGYQQPIKRRDIIVLALFIAFIKIGEGVSYISVDTYQINHPLWFSVAYLLPYLLSLVAVLMLVHHAKRVISTFLTISMALVGIGYLAWLVFPGGWAISSLLSLIGFAMMDVFIVALIMQMVYVYNGSFYIPSVLLVALMVGVALGAIVYSLSFAKGSVVIGVALTMFALMISLIFYPRVSQIIWQDMVSRRQALKQLLKAQTRREQSAKFANLSKREREVLTCIVAGDINRIIAQKLFISETTVKTHCKNIYQKVGVHSKKELVHLAASVENRQ